MKRVLLINGYQDKWVIHPILKEQQEKNAYNNGIILDEINISELIFQPYLIEECKNKDSLEPDLLLAIGKIKLADHLVWIYPVCWGSLPSKLKGFIDRVFIPGITFLPRHDSYKKDGLLLGKTAHIIAEVNEPVWKYWLRIENSGAIQLQQDVLEYCGISPVDISMFNFKYLTKEVKWQRILSAVYHKIVKT